MERKYLANEGIDALEFYSEVLMEELEHTGSKRTAWALFDVLAEKDEKERINRNKPF